MDLNWIASEQPHMETLLEKWVNVNSYTENRVGLKQMADQLLEAFHPLGAEAERLPLPPRPLIDTKGNKILQPLGEALHFRKRPNAPFRLFLCGHMDTVYPPDSPFQKADRISTDRMRGPGVADMKGGLVILLTLLRAIEKSPLSTQIGWELLLNPDEEIGSIGSREILALCARRNHLGLIFEPAFSDGHLVSSRKGTATFTIVAHGRAAHAGRDFASGRNAISALAKFLLKAESCTDLEQGTSVNVGQIRGGHAVNSVPDLAIGRLNVRAVEIAAFERVRQKLQQFIEEAAEGITLALYEDVSTPPKEFDEKQKELFTLLKTCAEELDEPLGWRPSGGACDGNRLQAHGLRTIDTLGAVGGNIHTPEEYVELPSLSKRTQLTALFVQKVVERGL